MKREGEIKNMIALLSSLLLSLWCRETVIKICT